MKRYQIMRRQPGELAGGDYVEALREHAGSVLACLRASGGIGTDSRSLSRACKRLDISWDWMERSIKTLTDSNLAWVDDDGRLRASHRVRREPLYVELDRKVIEELNHVAATFFIDAATLITYTLEHHHNAGTLRQILEWPDPGLML